MTDAVLSNEQELLVLRTLHALLNKDAEGQALLNDFEVDPSGNASALNRWLRKHSEKMPPPLATFVSGGQIEKLVNIAQAGIVLIQQTPPKPPQQDIATIWSVPRRNPFFTGREEILSSLHETLTAGKAAALTQAFSGLGGIGKTQTALEFAYRYSDEYKAVFWVRATSRDTAISDFISIAEILNLPEKHEQDQNETVKAVKHWLESNANWLLILDDVEDIDMINAFLPSHKQGHLLLTTRAQAGGFASNLIEITKMENEEGATFLLRRARIIAPDALLTQALDTDSKIAQEIVAALDGLPLALDQAGAYIEETQRSLSDYLNLYQIRRRELLKRRGNNPLTSGHPESVTTTLTLTFEKVQLVNPAAADLLRHCAFLHSADIPEDIIVKGADHLGPILQPVISDEIELDEAFNILFKYSLIRRNYRTRTLTIHRLVQAILIDEMDTSTQRILAEHIVKAVKEAFPDPQSKDWLQCQPYAPHLQICASLIKRWDMNSSEAISLLADAGFYFLWRNEYAESRILLNQSLSILNTVLGLGDASNGDTITYAPIVLVYLAVLEGQQGNYEEAEAYYLEALSLEEQLYGPEDISLASTLTPLASIYHRQNKYDEAENSYHRARMIREKAGKAEDYGMAAILGGLAYLYKDQGKYSEADNYYQLSQAMAEKELGPDHPEMAQIVHNRGRSYLEQGKYAEAELFFTRAIEISEKAWGPDNPDVAMSANHLGDLYRIQGKYDLAEQYLQRSLKIDEKTWGQEHPHIGIALNHLGILYSVQERYGEAEQLYERAIKIDEEFLGPEHIELGVVLTNRGLNLEKQGEYAKAELQLSRAYKIFKKRYASIPWHHHLINCLGHLWSLHANQGKIVQAKLLLREAQPIITEALKSGVLNTETTNRLNTMVLWQFINDREFESGKIQTLRFSKNKKPPKKKKGKRRPR